MVCLNDLNYEILLRDATPDECEKLIRDVCEEVYFVPAGYKIYDIPLIGSEYIPVGTRGSSIVFRFIKPCIGLFVLEVKDAQDEIERLRSGRDVIKET